MRRVPIFRSLFLGLLCIAASPASAAITYNLSDVKFAGGGSIEGWFTLSDDYSTLEDYSFLVPYQGMAQVNGNQLFTMPTDPSKFSYDPAGAITAINASYRLNLSFSQAFSSGNSLQLSGRMTGLRPVKPPGIPFYTITGGTAAPAVPEPTTWTFMILGFGLIGAMVRRKAQATRQQMLVA